MKTNTLVHSIFAGCLLLAVSAHAEIKQGGAEITALTGTVTYTTPSGGERTARIGDVIPAGSTINTAPGSEADLSIAKNNAGIKVTQNSSVSLDKLTYDQTSSGTTTDTLLNIKKGSIIGDVKKIASGSRFEVKTPVSVCGIRGTKFFVGAGGTVHVVSGTLLVTLRVQGPNGPVEKTFTVPAGMSLIVPPNATADQIANLAPTPMTPGIQQAIVSARIGLDRALGTPGERNALGNPVLGTFTEIPDLSTQIINLSN